MAEPRVLIVRVGAMGDVLHALPAVTALRKARPHWIIDWVVDDRWAPLLEANGFGGPVVDVAFHVAIREWKKKPFTWSTARELLEFRNLRGRYDFVVDMQGTLRSAAIGRLAGGSTLAGYADPREALAAKLYGRSIRRQGVHVVEQGAALLAEACGLALEPIAPEFPKDETAERWAATLVGDRKVCVLAPGAGWGAKQWPAQRFGELAQRLRESGYRCLVSAAREGEPLSAEVVAQSNGAAETVVCDMAGLIALVRRAQLFVGGDSGPMHLAAALGVPVVALFGPTDPLRNGPWGPGRKTVVRDSASVTSYKRRAELDPGLARVNVERVMEAVRSVI
jgi:heptosyltransferase-1